MSEVHDTFHVSNLKKCLADGNLRVPIDEIKIDKTLHFVEEPVEIMDREVKTLKHSKIPIVKVRWNSKRGPEFTWEREDHMKARFGETLLWLDKPKVLQFQLRGSRRRMSWREFFSALGLHTGEEMETLGVPRRFAAGRKSGALISGGQFIARLAEHFGLLTKERLQGLTVTAPALPIIDMTELVILQICVERDDTWAWVPVGPARHEGDDGGVTEEAPVAHEDGIKDEEMPQVVPPPARTQGERIARLEEEVHGMRETLVGHRKVLDSMAWDLSRFTT
ncbi:hypothetical protein Tco_0277210 [Tanacetum coccineum]